MATWKEKLEKTSRSLGRAGDRDLTVAGLGTSTLLCLGASLVAPAMLVFVPLQLAAAAAVYKYALPENAGSLEHATAQAGERIALRGDAKAIHTVQGLDRAIRRLTSKFNGVSRVPDDVVRKIDLHVRDVAPALAKVAASRHVQNDAFELLGTGELTHEAPCTQVEYTNTFRSQSGAEIEQRVTRIRFGMRA